MATLSDFIDDSVVHLNETDGVEILHALDVAAQVYATTGDKIMSAHFQHLYAIVNQQIVDSNR
jgi:hypothetical protein